jgi:hypothetical protein
VVDEIGRDQLADAFGLTVVQGVEDRQPGDADLRAFADTVEGQRAAGTAMSPPTWPSGSACAPA